MIKVSLLALACVLAVPPASSATSALDAAATVKVAYSDLDLSRGSDARIMLLRLERAALEACGASSFSFRDVRAEVRNGACYKDGMRQALTDLGAPTVSQAYLGASGVLSSVD